ncbi:hypothetical protein [Niallia sp. FSL R7-0271]|uniref:hypothetical protein n=1 Tax=Niallia sp. FSL R7-0271 TaxID=2921678 RepID=UPI0030F84B8D
MNTSKNLIYYMELQEGNEKEKNCEIVDIYGYENEVLVMARGFCKSYITKDKSDTLDKMTEISRLLIKAGFTFINQENKNSTEAS